MLNIGPYSNPSQVVTAPMAGVTDQPFRNLCRQFGAHWVVSEMVTSEARLWGTAKSRQRLRFHDEAEPRWIQIAGAVPSVMAAAARENVKLGAQIIDINMGCPAKKVCNRAAGSALMRDELLVSKILAAVVQAVDVPVTLKIRLGWSREEINAIKVATIAEQCGVQLLTVHGRTRACKFSGSVDYQSIAAVKAAVTIPVLANGDITSATQAANILELTGADGVMMGRAVQGKPWLPAEVSEYLLHGRLQAGPSRIKILNTMSEHVKTLSEFYGETAGVRIARKHIGWYLTTLDAANSSTFRQQFNQALTLHSQLELLESLFTDLRLAA